MFKKKKEFIKDAVMRRDACHNLVCEKVNEKDINKYGLGAGKVIARTIGSLHENITNAQASHYKLSNLSFFGQPLHLTTSRIFSQEEKFYEPTQVQNMRVHSVVTAPPLQKLYLSYQKSPSLFQHILFGMATLCVRDIFMK